MRLIDAEKYPCGKCGHTYCNEVCDEFQKWLEGCDYDIDKVVADVKANAKQMSRITVPHAYYKAIGTRKCEEIIRNGGNNL